jgi:hypothetical protein
LLIAPLYLFIPDPDFIGFFRTIIAAKLSDGCLSGEFLPALLADPLYLNIGTHNSCFWVQHVA